jgi:hypothetical protein
VSFPLSPPKRLWYIFATCWREKKKPGHQTKASGMAWENGKELFKESKKN